MNEGLEFAVQMLREHGEFHPFGVVRKTDGTIQHVGALDGRERPPAADLIALLHDSYRREATAGQYMATAIFYDVRIIPPGRADKTDAVQIELEHRTGYYADVFFPYTLGGERQVTLGQIFASKRDPVVFSRAG
jgi:arginase family enzyme